MYVSYIDDDYTRREKIPLQPNQKHREYDEFLESWRLDEKPQSPILLIVHGSNNELGDPFDEADAHGCRDGEDEKVLTYLVRRVCEDGGRVLAFSGGHLFPETDDVNEMKRVLTQSGYIENHHFAVRGPLDPIQGIDWEVISIIHDFPSNWKVDSILKGESQELELLLAFVILCQGYLAVHVAYKGSNRDWDDQDIVPALEQMGWTDFMKKGNDVKSLIRSDLGSKNNLGQVRGANWWSGVFTGESLRDGVKQEWDESTYGTIPEAVDDLLKLISHGSDIASPETVAEAYCAIADRLSGKESE